jgi:hypothetical protein
MTLEKRARAAAELLERLAHDWSQLEQLPDEERRRLRLAVARMYHTDPVARRRRMKTGERERKGGRHAFSGVRTLPADRLARLRCAEAEGP